MWLILVERRVLPSLVFGRFLNRGGQGAGKLPIIPFEQSRWARYLHCRDPADPATPAALLMARRCEI
jgi:hypothetical protein